MQFIVLLFSLLNIFTVKLIMTVDFSLLDGPDCAAWHIERVLKIQRLSTQGERVVGSVRCTWVGLGFYCVTSLPTPATASRLKARQFMSRQPTGSCPCADCLPVFGPLERPFLDRRKFNQMGYRWTCSSKMICNTTIIIIFPVFSLVIIINNQFMVTFTTVKHNLQCDNFFFWSIEVNFIKTKMRIIK